MEFETSFKINKICRICLEENIISSQSIFEQFVYTSDGTSSSHNTAATTTTTTIADIITECTKYPATQNDKLPTQICIKCKEAALTSHLFKRQTEQAYYHLKAIYDKTWSPKQEGKSDDALTTEKYTQTEKLFRNCESCPKQCASKQELKRHRLVAHSNDVKKKCRVCGEGFNHLGQLIVHLSTEHPNEGIHCEFKCHICNREFARKDHMTRHMRKIHKFEFNPPASAKISLEEPEIQFDDPSHAIAQTTSLNNYSSHWPEYKDDDKSYNANYTATNPFDSDNEMEKAAAATTDGHGENMQRQNFIPMNNVDVKQFVGTTVNPEVFIKEELIIADDDEDQYKYDQYCDDDLNDFKNDDDTDEPKMNAQTKDTKDNDAILLFDTDEEDMHDDDDDEDDYKLLCYDDGMNRGTNGGAMLPPNYQKQEYIVDNHTIKTEHFWDADSSRTQYARNPYTMQYHCQMCPLEFKLHRNLVRHMVTHSDNRPFLCDLCTRTFKRKDNLQKHLRDLHHEKLYTCEVCFEKFSTCREYRAHSATCNSDRN